jgi:putative phosphoribosyl transferase
MENLSHEFFGRLLGFGRDRIPSPRGPLGSASGALANIGNALASPMDVSFESERSPAIASFESARGGFPFADRDEAGRSLAASLESRLESRPALLLAPTAQALPVARAVARLLDAPWDVGLVRRIRLPGGTPVGAVSRGVMLINDGVLRRLRIEPRAVEDLALQVSMDLAREEAELRGGQSSETVDGRIAVVIDDGLGDPADWIAAARALRLQGAAAVWLAAPALDESARALVAGSVDEVLAEGVPPADGCWYAGERTGLAGRHVS